MSSRLRVGVIPGLLLGLVLAMAWWLLRSQPNEGRGIATAPAKAEMGAPNAPSLKTAAPVEPVTAPARIAPLDGPKEDAANLYKNALVLYNALTTEEKEIIAQKAKVVSPAAAQALLAKIQPILALLRRAETEGLECNWGITVDSIDSPLPHIMPVLQLVKTAKWAAEMEFAVDPSTALGDLEAASKVGHSVADEMLIGWLVSGASDALTIHALQNNFALLTPEPIRESMELLGGLNVLADLQQAVAREADALSGLASKLANAATREEMLNTMGPMMKPDEMALLRDLTPTQIQTQLAWAQNVERDFATKLTLPESEYSAWWSQVNSEADANPLTRSTLGTLSKMRESLQGRLVDQAMALSALTILSRGAAEGASAVLDPTTGQPFLYTPIPGGFELRSPFVRKGQPISMQFLTPAGAP